MKLNILVLFGLVFVTVCFAFGQQEPQNKETAKTEIAPSYKADKWFILQRKSETSIFTINPAKVIRNGEFTFAWIKEIDIARLMLGSEKGEPKGELKTYNLARWKIKCSTQEISPMQVLKYKEGEMIDMLVFDDDKFSSPPPDSVGDEILKNACRIADLKYQNL